MILSSGGTTGTPKGVVGLHRHYVAAGLQLYEWTKSAKQPWADVIMLPLPLFHVYANVGVQPLAFVGPNPLSLVPNPRDIGDLLKTIKQVKPRVLQRRADAVHRDPEPSRRPRRQGGPELDQAVFLRRGGADGRDASGSSRRRPARCIVEGYSLTEAMMACCVNPVQGTNKIGSIGMPLPDVDVRIVDAEDPATARCRPARSAR